MATSRQVRANQRNAAKSTGPKSVEGKNRSRENALKHGLAGAGVVATAEQREAVAERLDAWRDAYRPATDAEQWMYAQVVAQSVKIDGCQAEELVLREYQAERAGLSWDEDRGLAAEVLGATLGKRPALTARRLARTSQGCDWLIAGWRALGRSLDNAGAWTEVETARAFDLLGTPPELRHGTPWEPDDSARGLVDREVDRLETLRADVLDPLDASERAAGEQGFLLDEAVGCDPEPGRARDRLRRYESTCWKRLQWAKTQLKALQSHAETSPAVERTTPAPAPASVGRLKSIEELDAEYAEYERNLFRRLLAAPEPPPEVEAEPVDAAEPEAPGHDETPPAAAGPRLRDAVSHSMRPAMPNRRARRAAARQNATRDRGNR